MRTTFLIPTLVSLLSHIHGADATGQRVGCFGSVPSSYVSQGTNIYQSSDKCSSACSSYDFFAMTQGNECYCGSSYPSSVDGSNACSVACVGYPAENCGGSSAFVVMAQAGVDLSSYSNAASSSSAASSESPSSSSSSASSSTASTSSSSSSPSSSSSSSTPASSSLSPSTTVSSASSSASSSPITTSVSPSSSAPPSQTTNEKYTSLMTTLLENSSATVTSVVYVTQSPSASENSANSKSASVNKGAIIGGVVGGVLGFLVILAALLFLLRRQIFSRYADDDESIIADDIAYEEALKSNADGSNPFASDEDNEADKIMLGRRRLSDGSLADATDYAKKVLRVANPDDEQSVYNHH